EHRLVVSVLPGRRSPEHTQALVEDFRARTEGRIRNVMTRDENPSSAASILEVYGEEVVPERTGRPGRPAAPSKVPPKELVSATVPKVRANDRVVEVHTRLLYGTKKRLKAALEASAVSSTVTTVLVERHNGTDRNRNARKVRKTYGFSKDWDVHEAVTYFSYSSYNFCWPVRTLRERNAAGKWEQRTPARAAGLTDHVWTMKEWLTLPY